jgi:G3E family GTPase
MTERTDLPDPDDIMQVSLLTGFLGSGKTTLLNKLLKHPGMAETAVLINEFGEIGIDHKLVEKVDDEMMLLNAGCLCCTVRGDLSRALRELFVKRVQGKIPPIERVLIETTGLADPAPIIHTLMTDPVIANRFRLDGVITTVDAVNGDLQFDRYPESVKQAAVADRILLTKCDLADTRDIETLEAGLKHLNPGAPVFRIEHGAIDPEKLFNAGLYNPETKSIDVRRWLQEEAYAERDAHDHDHHHHDHGHGHGHGHHHGHGRAGQDPHDPNRHDEHIGSFCLTFDQPFAWQVFVNWIRELIARHGDALLRLKGIVRIEGHDEPLAVHGVQHLFHDPVPLPAGTDDDPRSRIVFITKDLDRPTVEAILDEARTMALPRG